MKHSDPVTAWRDPADKLDQFRELLRAVDPAAMTNADRGALLDLVAAAFAAAGVE